MKLLLDEMHAPAAAEALRRDSFDVLAVAAIEDLRGLSDGHLLVHAVADNRVIVTENIADFGPLGSQWAFDGRDHRGLVFTNPKRFNRATVAYPGNLVAALREFLHDEPVVGSSWIWWL